MKSQNTKDQSVLFLWKLIVNAQHVWVIVIFLSILFNNPTEQ